MKTTITKEQVEKALKDWAWEPMPGSDMAIMCTAAREWLEMQPHINAIDQLRAQLAEANTELIDLRAKVAGWSISDRLGNKFLRDRVVDLQTQLAEERTKTKLLSQLSAEKDDLITLLRMFINVHNDLGKPCLTPIARDRFDLIKSELKRITGK